MKALIAEDDFISRLMLTKLLTRWNFEVTAVEDGAEAWEYLQHVETPTIVLLDWMMPGLDGLVHISQLDSERVNKVEDIVNMGDEITVMVTGIDPAGKIRLSRQAVLEGWTLQEAQERDSKKSGPRPGGDRGGRPGGDRGGRPGGGDRGRSGGGNSGRR